MASLRQRAFVACSEGNLQDLVSVLSEAPDSVMLTDSEGMTLLHRAAFKGQLSITHYLLESSTEGPGLLSRPDSSQCLPLHYAAMANHPQIVQALLAHPSSHATINFKNHRGWTPLFFAAISVQQQQQGAAAASAPGLDTLELLLRAGARVDVVDANGRTPADWCFTGSVKERLRALGGAGGCGGGGGGGYSPLGPRKASKLGPLPPPPSPLRAGNAGLQVAAAAALVNPARGGAQGDQENQAPPGAAALVQAAARTGPSPPPTRKQGQGPEGAAAVVEAGTGGLDQVQGRLDKARALLNSLAEAQRSLVDAERGIGAGRGDGEGSGSALWAARRRVLELEAQVCGAFEELEGGMGEVARLTAQYDDLRGRAARELRLSY
jgi:hypothetical protein